MRVLHGIRANPVVATCYPQQAAVVHPVQQLGAGPAVAAKPVSRPAVGKLGVHFARVCYATIAHELEHRFGLPPPCSIPLTPRDARMHGSLYGARQDAVVDEEVLLQSEPRIARFQVARPVVQYAMPQGQVLRAGRSPDRIHLHEAKSGDGPLQRSRPEQAAGNRVAAEGVERERCWHGGMICRS